MTECQCCRANEETIRQLLAREKTTRQLIDADNKLIGELRKEAETHKAILEMLARGHIAMERERLRVLEGAGAA